MGSNSSRVKPVTVSREEQQAFIPIYKDRRPAPCCRSRLRPAIFIPTFAGLMMEIRGARRLIGRAGGDGPILVRGRYRDPSRKKTHPRTSTGMTESMATVRLVGRRPRSGPAPRMRRTDRRRVDHARSAEHVRDLADQDRRADVAEQVDQEDAEGVAGGAAVRGDHVRRHRVARTEHHRHQDRRDEQESERRSVGVEHAERGRAEWPPGRPPRQQQVSPPRDPRNRSGTTSPGDSRAGRRRQHPADPGRPRSSHPMNSLVKVEPHAA